MKSSKLLFFTLSIIISVFLSGCGSDDDGGSSASSSSATGSGCKTRLNGVKDGLNDLYLPYPNGDKYTVTQTWEGTYSHDGEGSEHALDFGMNTNDAINAVAKGRVIAVKEDSNKNCSSSCNDANYVIIDHGDGFIGRYYHFCQNCVDVAVGDVVDATTRIGGAGNTGWSTGTHLHFELADWEEGCSVTYGFKNINSGARTALTVNQEYTSASVSDTNYTASKIGGNTYDNVGVTLTSETDWYVEVNDVLNFKGSLNATAKSEGSDAITIFIVDSSNKLVDNTRQTYSTTDSFDVNYTIPSLSAGTYMIAISKSKSGSYSWNNPPYLVVH